MMTNGTIHVNTITAAADTLRCWSRFSRNWTVEQSCRRLLEGGRNRQTQRAPVRSLAGQSRVTPRLAKRKNQMICMSGVECASSDSVATNPRQGITFDWSITSEYGVSSGRWFLSVGVFLGLFTTGYESLHRFGYLDCSRAWTPVLTAAYMAVVVRRRPLAWGDILPITGSRIGGSSEHFDCLRAVRYRINNSRSKRTCSMSHRITSARGHQLGLRNLSRCCGSKSHGREITGRIPVLSLTAAR